MKDVMDIVFTIDAKRRYLHIPWIAGQINFHTRAEVRLHQAHPAIRASYLILPL